MGLGQGEDRQQDEQHDERRHEHPQHPQHRPVAEQRQHELHRRGGHDERDLQPGGAADTRLGEEGQSRQHDERQALGLIAHLGHPVEHGNELRPRGPNGARLMANTDVPAAGPCRLPTPATR